MRTTTRRRGRPSSRPTCAAESAGTPRRTAKPPATRISTSSTPAAIACARRAAIATRRPPPSAIRTRRGTGRVSRSARRADLRVQDGVRGTAQTAEAAVDPAGRLHAAVDHEVRVDRRDAEVVNGGHRHARAPGAPHPRRHGRRGRIVHHEHLRIEPPQVVVILHGDELPATRRGAPARRRAAAHDHQRAPRPAHVPATGSGRGARNRSRGPAATTNRTRKPAGPGIVTAPAAACGARRSRAPPARRSSPTRAAATGCARTPSPRRETCRDARPKRSA